MDANKVPTVKFNNGQTCPIIGLGTWQAPPDGSLYRAVKQAIDDGYRHLDCALVYENEEETGRAMNDAIAEGKVSQFLSNLLIYLVKFNFLFDLKVKREDLFIVSKVWLTFLKRDRVMTCVKKILAKFNTPYLDLCLLHWPMCFAQVDDTLWPKDANGKIIGGDVDSIEAYQGLEDCLKAGLVKNIGISNFTSAQVERLLKAVTVVPVTNQVLNIENSVLILFNIL